MPTVKFYIRGHKIKGKLREDEVRIIARISAGRGKRFEIRTEEKVIPKYWNKQEVKSTYRGHYEINLALHEFKTKILKVYRDNPGIDFEQFKKLITGEINNQQKKTLFLALDLFLSTYKIEKDKKTLAKYHTMQAQLIAFSNHYDFDLKTLDFNFYDAFKRHLYAIPNPNYKGWSLKPVDGDDNTFDLVHSPSSAIRVGLFDDTVYKYIINLKTFLAWAEKRNYQVHPSYKSWEIINRKYDPISLSTSELEKLESIFFTSKSEDIARDYLVLQCRTGQRISDIKRFDLKNFVDNKWTFTQKKGNRLSRKTTTVHFKGYCAPALNILEKYNWKLPDLSEQKINKHIKQACKKAGIDAKTEMIRYAQNKRIIFTCPKYDILSNHSGRKTFITLALQSSMAIEYVMELTGITRYDTIRHYKARFEDSAIEEQLEKISGKPLMKKAQ